MKAVALTTKRKNLLWLQSGGCGGCTMSLLCAEKPDLFSFLEQANIELLGHPAITENTGDESMQVLDDIIDDRITLDYLCIEGALLRGPNGSGLFHLFGPEQTPFIDWVRKLVEKAEYVIAVGSCASFAGMTSAGSDPTDASGLQYKGSRIGGVLAPEFRSRSGLPVINISGCPVHPNWVTEVLMSLSMGDFNADDLDEFRRPKGYTDYLVHHGCPRNEFYEYKASAKESSQLGCLMEHLGCVATQARADCNIRLWNGEGSCSRGGYACINCTAPEFEEPGHSFLKTPKLGNIPIGLPTDMPKAWFVALSALSKAATPVRLSTNAHTDHIVVKPGKKSEKSSNSHKHRNRPK